MSSWSGLAWVSLLALSAGGACATGRALVDPREEASFYQEVVASLTGRPSAMSVDPERLDYARLRRARHLSAGQRDAATLSALGAKVSEARRSSDERRAMSACHELLDRDFTDVEAHLEKARWLHERQGHAAAFHERVALGLLRSITEGAELDDPIRPYRVYSAREEEAVLAFLDLTPVRRWPEQGLAAVEARDRGGRLRRLYFGRP